MPSADLLSARPTPTPSEVGIEQRLAAFATLTDALDYASGAATGLNVYSARGELVETAGYREVRRRSRAFARRVLHLGPSRGDRIGLLADASLDFVVALLGCQYAALVPVPLPGPAAFGDRESYLDRIARQLTHSGARLVVGPEALVDALDARRAWPVPVLGWSEVRELPDGADLPEPPGPDELCYVQYSSGSTRFPAGVANTQRALLANCRAIARDALAVRPGDRTVSWLPLHHDMGLVGTLLASIACQLSVDLMASEDFARRPIEWLRLIARNGGTISYSPCFGYELCVRRFHPGEGAGMDLSRWRVAGVGGEMIRPEAIRSFCETFAPAGFRASSVVASYGLAEATLGVTFAALGRGLETDPVDRHRLAAERCAVPADSPDARSFARCGRPMPGYEVEVRGDDGGPVPERRVGRIFVRGPSVMQGYLADPEATARALGPGGWLDTGDLGYLADGSLVVVGRAKDTIIINGRNIAPQDLEWSVGQLPGLRAEDCAAFAVTRAEGREEAVVLIQCRTREPARRAELVALAKQVVRRTCGIECHPMLVPPKSLPRTSSGKLSRSAARDRFVAGEYGDVVEHA